MEKIIQVTVIQTTNQIIGNYRRQKKAGGGKMADSTSQAHYYSAVG
jgi:hypothetical protein